MYLFIASVGAKLGTYRASLVYFILGAFGSILLLIGIVLLVREGGMQTNLATLRDFILYNVNSTASYASAKGLAQALILCGLLFKVGAVPGQYWVHSTYQFMGFPVVAFYSVVTKFAFIMVIIRIFVNIHAPFLTVWAG